ncbi:hypothetical protein I79_024823 [Cricetulus griseus]|uniref:Uncharacterized protein n=1 Tax=Cricetulus griseus TaxID=10029 RepID=G3ILQ2_CRIGR|nr:hypothetical protein I79_024823 [Cricetulus griseus]
MRAHPSRGFWSTSSANYRGNPVSHLSSVTHETETPPSPDALNPMSHLLPLQDTPPTSSPS